jgi:UDP-N-acetylmuramyl pentapeptide phosphotransferase/UDP-N-acetylglucosamine-1-phosphate transferase
MFLAMLVIPRILVIAIRHSLYDVPDFRKTHNGAVPRIGGVSFIPCILFSMLFMLGVFHLYIENTNENWLYPYYSEFNLLFCGLLLLYLGGVKDDLVGMHYLYKFIIQIISSLLIVLSGLYLNNMYGFLGMYEISPWIGIPLTVVALVFIINAINLIDGMDGLVSGLSIIALCIYGILFFISGIWFYSMLAFSTIGVLVIFFYYNVFGNVKKRGKLFMGDSGSMTLGFILGFLALRYTFFEPEVTKPVGNALIMAVSPLLIPIFDAMRVILSRIKKHKHLFKPDRSHIHHKLICIY